MLTGQQCVLQPVGGKQKERKLESQRFKKFTLLIDGIHKCIHKMKADTMTELGIKGVHVFWLYHLLESGDGLTGAELAAATMVDRSLVSRELDVLSRAGYVEILGDKSCGRRSYNSRIILTDKGRELALKISAELLNVQSAADEGITAEELSAFYITLEKLHRNFVKMTTPTAKREL